jgi:hypothetical protein
VRLCDKLQPPARFSWSVAESPHRSETARKNEVSRFSFYLQEAEAAWQKVAFSRGDDGTIEIDF